MIFKISSIFSLALALSSLDTVTPKYQSTPKVTVYPAFEGNKTGSCASVPYHSSGKFVFLSSSGSDSQFDDGSHCGKQMNIYFHAFGGIVESTNVIVAGKCTSCKGKEILVTSGVGSVVAGAVTVEYANFDCTWEFAP